MNSTNPSTRLRGGVAVNAAADRRHLRDVLFLAALAAPVWAATLAAFFLF